MADLAHPDGVGWGKAGHKQGSSTRLNVQSTVAVRLQNAKTPEVTHVGNGQVLAGKDGCTSGSSSLGGRCSRGQYRGGFPVAKREQGHYVNFAVEENGNRSERLSLYLLAAFDENDA